MARDEFPEKVKQNLAKRVAYRCSFPGCSQPTSGPDDGHGAVLSGAAAHICAASPNGPRHDPNQTAMQRSSIENGIWLCINHHEIIDGKPETYTAAVLRGYKRDAERMASRLQAKHGGDHSNSLPTWFHLPHRRNRQFVGRELELKALAESLAHQATAITPMTATTGLGGIGKSQLAVEYAYRYAGAYPGGVFWLNCEQVEAVAGEIAACGVTMKLFDRDAQLPQQQKIQAVLERWRQDTRPRLLVFDNCEDERVLQEWAPQEPHTHLLVTSRRSWPPRWKMQALALKTLARPDSIALLLAHRDDLTATEADHIAAELGDLPLALYLAGCYLDTYRATISPNAYLEALRQAPLDHGSLLGRGADGYQPTAHDCHVAQTFATSFYRLEASQQVDALAQELLLRASFLAPGAPFAAEHLAAADRDPEQLGAALDRLRQLGLLQREGQNFVIHRLLAHFSQALYPAARRDQVEALVAVRVAYLAETVDNSGLPARMAPYLAHLRHLAERYAPTESLPAARLSNALGYYLHTIAAYGEAERWYRLSLACAEQIHGPSDPETAIRLNNLALLLKTTQRLAEAEPLHRRALAIDEAALGPDHPNVAIRLNNLANLLSDTQRQAEAEPLHRRALAIDEAALGPDHPKVAIHLNNLAGLLEATQRLAEAEPLYRRALAIDEAALGPDHPNVAIRLNNLAGLLRATQRLAEAEPLCRRALAIDEAALGPDHLDLARDLNNLAGLLRDTQRLAEAEPLYRRAVAICLTALGAEHPWTNGIGENWRIAQAELAGGTSD